MIIRDVAEVSIDGYFVAVELDHEVEIDNELITPVIFVEPTTTLRWLDESTLQVGGDDTVIQRSRKNY